MSATNHQRDLGSISFPIPDARPVPVLWGDTQPCSHLVQFYEDDSFLIDALARWFGDGLGVGDSCVYVGTEVHRISLQKKLADRGFDLVGLRKKRRFVCPDASETLSTFMVDEWPHEAL